MSAPARAQGAARPPVAAGATVEFRVNLRNGNRGRQRLRTDAAPTPGPAEPGNVPRIARLMALAIRFEGLIRQGAVRDYAELARLGHISRPRATQLMNLLNLAPDIMEQLLFLPRTVKGKDPVTERQVRPIAAVPDWRPQRRMWNELMAQVPTAIPTLDSLPGDAA